MAIDHKLKVIFLHQPRIAGTSIEIALFGNDWWFIDHKTKHITSALAMQIYKEYWSSYTSFAVIRHPLDWLVSLYTSYNRGGNKSFEDYVRQPIFSPHEHQYTAHQHQNIAGVNYVLEFETINRDFPIFCKNILNVDVPKLKRSTLDTISSKRKDRGNWKEYYSQSLLEEAKELYKKDMTLFGYS